MYYNTFGKICKPLFKKNKKNYPNYTFEYNWDNLTKFNSINN